MTSEYLYRVLRAVQTLAVQHTPLTLRAIQREMGVDATNSSGSVSDALDALREAGYVKYVDGTAGTLRYTEHEVYQ